MAQSQVGTRAAGMAGAFVGCCRRRHRCLLESRRASAPARSSARCLTPADFKRAHRSGKELQQKRIRAPSWRFPRRRLALPIIALGAYGTAAAAEPAVVEPRRPRRSAAQCARAHDVYGRRVARSLAERAHRRRRDAKGDALPRVGTAVDVDAGVIAWVNRFRFGLVGRNLTTPAFRRSTAAAQSSSIARSRIGGAWGSGWTGISRVIVSVDGDVLSRPTLTGDRRDVAAGVETWWMQQRLGLRGGSPAKHDR